MSDLHVLPINDLREHAEHRRCWCRPHVDEHANGAAVVTHHALDGREYREPGGPAVPETTH